HPERQNCHQTATYLPPAVTHRARLLDIMPRRSSKMCYTPKGKSVHTIMEANMTGRINRILIPRQHFPLILGVTAVLLVSVAFGPTLIAQAQGGNSQIFGNRYRSGGYHAVEAYMTTPNPSISYPNWAGGPTALGEFPNPPFIESGPTKACDIDCGLHPYGAWGTTAGGGGEHVDTSIWLGAGFWYRYRSYYLFNGQWQSQFCSGSGCTVMVTGNLQTANLHMAGSGGESSGVRWGSISTGSATYKPYFGSTWYGWCYTSTWLYNVPGGSISSCVNNGWTATWQ
ncbi:MAG: hypothetical protein ACREBU_18590, partial [Nitrososphaera sp.]